MDNAGARGGLGTVLNAVRLLEHLAEGPAYQQLTDLAERSGMTIPTVHRLLRSMVIADLVEQDPHSSRYGLGRELTRLSHQYLSRLPLLGALGPYLPQLRSELDATVHVETLVRGSVVYIDHVDGGDGGPYRDAHRVHPALATAGGRVLASRADDDTWNQVLERDTGEWKSAGVSRREEWAAAAWLAAPGPDPTLPAEVAVPVIDGEGLTVAALASTVADPGDEAAAESVASHLTRAARAAGRTLGRG